MSADDNAARPVDAPGVDVDVATDPEDSQTIVTGMTVSVEETVSTGDYESFTPTAYRRLQFRPAINVSDPAGRVKVRREAMKALRDTHADIQAAIDARMSVHGEDAWPNGVTPADLTDGGE